MSGPGGLHGHLRSFLPPLAAANRPPWDLLQPGWGLPRHTLPLSGSPSCPQGPTPGQTPFWGYETHVSPLWLLLERGGGNHTEGQLEGQLAPRCLRGVSHELLLFRSFTRRWEPIATRAAVASHMGGHSWDLDVLSHPASSCLSLPLAYMSRLKLDGELFSSVRRSVAYVWTLPSAPRGLERDYSKTIATKTRGGRLLPARQRRPAAFPDGYLESGSQETINQRGARPEGRATAITTVSVTAEGASGLCKAVGAGGGRGHVNKPHGCQGLRSALPFLTASEGKGSWRCPGQAEGDVCRCSALSSFKPGSR